MALGTNHQSATTLAVAIPEIWGGTLINDIFRKKLKAAPFFWDVSEFASSGGDTIHIPNLTEMSANDKTNGSQVTLNASTETKVTLSISTWKEVSFLIEKKEARQVLHSYSLQEKYMSNAAYTAAKELDTALLTLYSGLSQSVGASNTSLTDATILSAIQTVAANDVPLEECAFFFNSNQVWGDLMAIDKYVNFDYRDGKPVSSGMIGKLYGFPVYETNNLVTTSSGSVAHGLFAHKDAFAFATSTSGVEVDANYIPEYLGVLVTADIIFGVVENRDAAAVHILSNN